MVTIWNMQAIKMAFPVLPKRIREILECKQFVGLGEKSAEMGLSGLLRGNTVTNRSPSIITWTPVDYGKA